MWHELTRQGYQDNKLDLSLDIKSIMETWTLKKGYPVLNITKEQTNSSTKLIITQQWFLLNPASNLYKQKSVYDTYKWFIPVTYTTKSKLNFDFETKPFWLKPNDTERKRLFLFFFADICCHKVFFYF